MEWIRSLACLFCGIGGTFCVLIIWCSCVLAKRADEAWEQGAGQS